MTDQMDRHEGFLVAPFTFAGSVQEGEYSDQDFWRQRREFVRTSVRVSCCL